MILATLYTPFHRDAVLLLTQRMHEESKYTDKYEVSAVDEYLSLLNTTSTNPAWVATHNGDVVGFMALSVLRTLHNHSKQAYSTATYVVPKMRHTTAFLRLHIKAVHWCRQHGVSTMLMGTPDLSDRARRVYTKLGFEPWELIMRKEI